MCEHLTESYHSWLQRIKNSPIKFWSLRLKDPDENARWLEQQRTFILERATIYLHFMVLVCLLTPLLFFFDTILAQHCLVLFLSSTLPLLGCVLFARHQSLVAVEFILPLNFLSRAVATLIIESHTVGGLNGGCMPMALDAVLRNGRQTFNVVEVILFATNMFVVVLWAIPVNMKA